MNPNENPLATDRDASAAARCWMARFRDESAIPTPVAHDAAECAWHEYPSDLLLEWVEDYRDRRDLARRGGLYG